MAQKHKNILIISPEDWGISKLSKHHYALAFAQAGFNVYFLTVNFSSSPKKDEACPDHKNIRLVSFPISKNLNWFRFHFRFWYNAVLKSKVKKWLKKYPDFEYVLSFDCNGAFTDLSSFKGEKTIFFPADQVNAEYRKEYRGFDQLVSISPVILEAFSNAKNKTLLHHGLSPDFIEGNKLEHFDPENKLEKVAYVGNLLIGPILDKANLTAIIENNPEIEFHFYGAFQKGVNNLGGTVSEDTTAFVDFLKNSENCVLHGMVSSKTLSEELRNQDAFLICYDYDFDKNKCSNSHKILEYLATGKPIISTRISMYDDLKLFPMLPTFDNSEFPTFFNLQKENWSDINSKEAFNERRNFAFANSYKIKVEKLLTLFELTNIKQLP